MNIQIPFIKPFDKLSQYNLNPFYCQENVQGKLPPADRKFVLNPRQAYSIRKERQKMEICGSVSNGLPSGSFDHSLCGRYQFCDLCEILDQLCLHVSSFKSLDKKGFEQRPVLGTRCLLFKGLLARLS